MTLPGTRLTYTFTSADDIKRLVSESGVENWTDDLMSQSDALTEVIEYATLFIRQYTDPLYTDSTIYNNMWVRRNATIIAAYELSVRRGDPGIYGARVQEIESRLQDIQLGMAIIPGATQSANVIAVGQNPVIDNRYFINRNRVRAEASNDTIPNQNTMRTYLWEWYGG